MSQNSSPARRRRPFTQVDVFADEAYRGNPLAVVGDAVDLSTEQMQHFANWTNLSETTFLLPPTHPDADYRVRIFTAQEEFPFAGHPTLGSAHAWLEAGGVPKRDGVLVQECAAGLVRVKRDGGPRAFACPARRCWTPPGWSTAPHGSACSWSPPGRCWTSGRTSPPWLA